MTNTNALILDIRIAEFKERGNKLVHRGRSAQPEGDVTVFKKLWRRRQKLVQARWEMVPDAYRKWAYAKAYQTNVAMKFWRQEHKVKGTAE